MEGGDLMWRVATSCVQMYKAGLQCDGSASTADELCCTTADKEVRERIVRSGDATHTQTHTHTPAHTHTAQHTRRQTHAQTDTQTYTDTRSHTHSHTQATLCWLGRSEAGARWWCRRGIDIVSLGLVALLLLC